MGGFYYGEGRKEADSNNDNGIIQSDNKDIKGRTEEWLKRGFSYYFNVYLFDLALLYGMTSEEYWYGNPDNLENFSHAFKKKMLLQEQNNWEIGQYVLSALQCSPVPVYLILDSKQCEKLPKYPQSPLQTEQEKQNRPSPEKCQQIQKDYLRIQILKNRYSRSMNK